MPIDYELVGRIIGGQIFPVVIGLYIGYVFWVKYKKVRKDPKKLNKMMGVVENSKKKK